jgi:hypothetical protein
MRKFIPVTGTAAIVALRARRDGAERNKRSLNTCTAAVPVSMLRNAQDGLELTLAVIGLACAVLEAQQADYDLEVATTLRNVASPVLSGYRERICEWLLGLDEQKEVVA